MPFEVKIAFAASMFSALAMLFGLAVLIVLGSFGLSGYVVVPIALFGFFALFNEILRRTENTFAHED